MFNCDQFSLVRGHDLVPSKPHTQNLPYPRDYFNPIFCIGRVGDKNNLGKFFKMGFGTKKYHFCVLFSRTATIAIFHKKYEKVLKTTQNVPKTVDNHQE